MIKKLLRRSLSFMLAGSMILTSLPAYAATPKDESLKEQLRSSISDEEYPNGLFGFYQTQLSVNEGEKTSITVCRQGNTDTEATVRFKAIDISAKYGDDYVLTVNHSTFKKEQLEANENATPLMQQGVYSGEPNNEDVLVVPDEESAKEEVISEEAVPQQEEAVSEEAAGSEEIPDLTAADEEIAAEGDSAVVDASAVEPAAQEEVATEAEEEVSAEAEAKAEAEAEAEAEEANFSGRKSGLAAAYEAQMGSPAPSNDWTESNPETVPSEIGSAMQEGTEQTVGYFEKAEGEEVVLTFKPGEYEKEIIFESFDDEKSESDEQMVFAIYGAEGAQVGKDYNGFVNIKDNDEAVDMVYAMRDKQVVVNADEDTAKVTVYRTSGTDQIGFVTVGTKSVDAVANEDYEAGTQELIFAPGETEKEVEIAITGDRKEDKSFYVGISSEGVELDEENNATLVTIAGQDSVEIRGVDENGNITSMGTVQYGMYKDGWVLGPVDLRLADKITVYYNIWGQRTEKKCKKTYTFTDKKIKATVWRSGGDLLATERSHTGYDVYDSISWSRNLSSNITSWSSLGSAWIWVGGWATGDNNSCTTRAYRVDVNYPTFRFNINNQSTVNQYYTEKQYSGNTQTADKPTIKLGEAYFGSKGTIEKSVQSGQSLGLGFDYSYVTNSAGTKANSNTVEFVGYVLKKKGTSNSWSDPIPELKNGAVIDYNFISKYAGTYMHDNNSFYIAPVFKPKKASVKFVNNNTSKVNYKGYKNGSTVNATKMDSFVIGAAANTGFSVSSIGISGSGYSNSNLNNGSADKSSFTTGLGNVSATSYTVSLGYDNAKVIVMADPLFKNTDAIKHGVVLYIDKDTKTVYSAAVNRRDLASSDKFEIKNVLMNTTYNIIGTAEDVKKADGTVERYAPAWRDGTLDDTEQGTQIPAKKNGYESFTPVRGSVLPYTTKLAIGRVYYTFEKAQEVGTPANIYGYLVLKDRMLLTGKQTEAGLNGAMVTANGNPNVVTNVGGTNKYNQNDGFFKIEDKSFSALQYYLVNVSYNGDEGSINTAFVINPARVGECYIDTANDLNINNVKVKTCAPGKDGKYDEKKFEEKSITSDPETGLYYGLNNGDTKIRLEMHADKDGVAMNSGQLQFYDIEGKKLVDKKVDGKAIGDENSGNFQFDFVPKDLELPPGTTVRVTFTDNQGHTYLQRQTGISLTEALGNLDVANSFAFGGLNTAIEMVGTINSSFNLGWNGDFDKSDAVVTNELGDKTITVGFNKKVIEKSDERSNIKKAADKLAEKDQAIADVNKEINKLTKKKTLTSDERDELKKLSTKADEAIKAKKTEQENYDKTVADAQNPNKTHTNVGGGASLEVGFSFALTFGLDKTCNKYYFKEMILTATISGGGSVTVSFATPVGVTIYLGFAAGGEGSASFVVEERKDQMNPKKYYVSQLKSGDSGAINVFDCNMNDGERKYDAYGCFKLKPYISISVGAGVLGDMIKVEVKGTAQFDMTFFTNEQEDCGSVNLSAELTVKVLIISHTWQLASTNINLFGNSGATSLGTEGTTYLYDSADILQAQDMSYMEGGSIWNSGVISAKSIDESEGGYVETPIANKIAEDPSFKMVALGDTGKYAGVFLNVDDSRKKADGSIDSLNSKAAYYTIYNGTEWSTPVILESDGFLDQDVDIFELGSRGAVITWSTADKKFTDETSRVDMQNSLNLHCAIIDTTGKVGDIQNVTKTTTKAEAGKYADTTADVAANVSYNATDMIVYYQKSEYSGDLLGDVLFPDATVMAARTYNFANGTWKDTSYTEDEYNAMTAEEKLDADQYDAGFYGQRFFDFVPVVSLNETLDEEGFWKDGKAPEIVQMKDDALKALVIDSDAMSYNDLGVFAYTVDMDGDLNTLNDRDVYMQIYDFVGDTFKHPMVINSDSVEDANVRFVRIPVKNSDTTHETWLTWLHNGDIVGYNMTNIVRNYNELLKQGSYEYDSTEFEQKVTCNYYYLDKSKKPAENAGDDAVFFEPYTTFVEGDAGNSDQAKSSITGFDVNASGSYVYFVWTQTGEELDDINKPDVDEAEAEIVAAGVEDEAEGAAGESDIPLTETQMYTARVEIGTQSAEGFGITVTKPVQITSTAGANYSDAAFMVNGDKLIGLAYKAMSKPITLEEYNAKITKYNEELKANKLAVTEADKAEANKEEIPLADEDTFIPYSVLDVENAKPYSFVVDPKSVVKVKNAEFSDRVVAGTEAHATFDILNDGVDTVEGLKVTAVDAAGKSVLLQAKETVTNEKATDKDGNEIDIDALSVDYVLAEEGIELDKLVGGYSNNYSCLLSIPEDATDATIKVTIKKGETVIATETIKQELAPSVGVSDLQVEGTGVRNQYKVTGTITNNGGAKAAAGEASIGTTKTSLVDGVATAAESEIVKIPYGILTPDQEESFEKVIDLDPATAFVLETDEETGAICETATVYARTSGGYDETEVVRIADDQMMKAMNAITDVKLQGAADGVLTVEPGEETVLIPEITSTLKNEADGIVGDETLQYRFESANEEVFKVDSGQVATAVSAGETEVTMYAYPMDVAFNSQNREELAEDQEAALNNEVEGTYDDIFAELPEKAIYKKVFKVKVAAADVPTPAPTAAPTAAPTDAPTAAPTVAPAQAGDTITSGTETYKVLPNNEVAFTGTTAADATTVTIPDIVKAADGTDLKVTKVEAGAFKGNKKIKKVKLGKNVTSVEKDAFSGCTSLTSVTLDEALTDIQENAFAGCKALKSVVIPKNVKNIKKNAFKNCKSLKTIKIKAKNLKSVGRNAFKGINKKAKFKLTGNKKEKAAVKKLFTKKTGFKKTMTIK